MCITKKDLKIEMLDILHGICIFGFHRCKHFHLVRQTLFDAYVEGSIYWSGGWRPNKLSTRTTLTFLIMILAKVSITRYLLKIKFKYFRIEYRA